MSKRKLNHEKKHSGPTMLTYFPKLSRSNANPSSDQSHSATIGISDLTDTPQQSDKPPEKNKEEPTKSSTDENRHFQERWLNDHSWLQFDREKNMMTCSLCIKHKKKNAMTSGTNNFRTSTLTRHADHTDHKAALLGETLRPGMKKCLNNVFSEKGEALKVALKTVYFLASEDIPMHKYEKFMKFLAECDCPHVSKLSQGKNATYESDTSANDMLQTIASVIRKDIDNKLLKSPFISVYADESTDIGMQKKLVVYARGIDPDSYTPATYYLENVKVTSGSGQVVSQAMLDCIEDRKIPMSKVMGFGSDGAKAMTGRKEGVTGHLMRDNPMLLNYHCIAHRLALVSSQAADSIPYMKEYQEILTDMFYFFKGSANRNEKLKQVQELLDEPALKVKEVHEVRWMSIYKAVETVYKCLDSLLSVFSTDKDPKAKGYSKKLGNSDFISTTYMLMDILPIITELCLVFQKKDLDVSLVQVSVDQCLKDLERYKTGEPAPLHPTYLDQLKEHLKTVNGRLMFKDNHIIAKGNRRIETLKVSFVDKLVENLNDRFPEKDSNIMYAFGCLAMRPLSFLSKEELSVWGDEKINILTEHFGKDQEHTFGSNQSTITEAIINPEETRKEWKIIKPLVVNEGYARDKMYLLWAIISKNHRETFPNLMKLAAIALTAPIHTADCERGFSKQNKIKTFLRNRITPERVDDLITVKCEGPVMLKKPVKQKGGVPVFQQPDTGPDLAEFWDTVLKQWFSKTDRRISLY